LRTCKVVSAAISVVQSVLFLIALVFVLLVKVNEVVPIVAAIVSLVLEVTDVTVARKALRLVTPEQLASVFAVKPLSASDRCLVTLTIVSGTVFYVLLVATLPMKSFHGEDGLGIAVVLGASLPGLLAELRVLRKNTWFAIARIPSKARIDESAPIR